MYKYFQSYYKSTQYMLSLIRFSEDKINEIDFIDEEYLGLDNNTTPVRVFYSQKKTTQSVIIFPGASPYAEEHPGMIMLANALRNVGFNVFLPRIPNLKNLLIVKKNVQWFEHCYLELLKHQSMNSNPMVVGLSYGGANLLKSSLSKSMQNNPPKSILSYGTYFSIQSALDFFVTGNISYNNKTFHITPHEWGTIVIFYNFISTIETSHDKEKITKLLKYRIEDNDLEVEKTKKSLNDNDKKLIDKILNGKIDHDIKLLIEKMIDKNRDLLEYLSPKKWAKNISTKTFIIHGANDSMVPFTESVLLAENINKSELLISFLYEHREISTDRGIFFKAKEAFKMIRFFAFYFRYNQ